MKYSKERQVTEMYSFFVPGKPQGKERPRVTRYGTYTPKKTKEYEELVRACFMQKYKAIKPVIEKLPVAAFIVAYYKIPKSITKAEKSLILEGNVFPVVKPDADNIAKAILDSLNGLAFNDDNQVVKLQVDKRYAVTDDEMGVKVFITDFREHPELFKDCIRLGGGEIDG